MGVVAIWRYPIKAMLGETLARVRVTGGGLLGDRRWVVVDRQTGERIANKRGRTDARLRACRAELGTGDDAGSLKVTLPSGQTAFGEEIDPALSDLLEVDVSLDERDDAAPRLGAPAGHQDFAPLHLLTSETLAFLRTHAPASSWDARRFRANLLLGGGQRGGFVEDRLIGSELRGSGGVRMRVAIPTPRCVVPTRASEELRADPNLLRVVAERHRVDLGPFGRAACLGAYADVISEGWVAVGERLEVVHGDLPPQQSLRATIADLVDRDG
jgi:uncharacterized protein YcbX